MRIRGVLAITLFAVLLFSGTPAGAGERGFGVLPIDVTTDDPCTGELVHITGEAYLWNDLTIQNGIAHQRSHLVLNGSGVGLTSGNSYVLHDVEDFENNIALPQGSGTDEYNNVATNHMISQGSADNLRFRFTFKVTFNANGDVTVTSLSWETDCLG